MEYSVPALDVPIEAEGCVFDLESLYARLAQLADKRHARGLRHALVTVLVYIVLAKLAGQDRVYGISQWAKHRQAALATALGLARLSKKGPGSRLTRQPIVMYAMSDNKM